MKVLRTGAILILLSVLLVVAGGAIGGRGGMQIALVFAVVMNFASYFFSDKIALASSGAKPVSREQLPRLYDVMERLAAKLPPGFGFEWTGLSLQELKAGAQAPATSNLFCLRFDIPRRRLLPSHRHDPLLDCLRGRRVNR